MTIWYAITLKPTATRQAHGHTLTRVELALRKAGIEYYLPMEEKSLIHHRTKQPISRRFPLVPGYIFCADIRDWPAFERIDEVRGPIRIQGTPMPIMRAEIERLREAEAQIAAANQLAERNKALTRKRINQIYPSGSTVRIRQGHIAAGQEARVTAATGRRTVKALLEYLGGLVEVEIGLEHLEAAE